MESLAPIFLFTFWKYDQQMTTILLNIKGVYSSGKFSHP